MDDPNVVKQTGTADHSPDVVDTSTTAVEQPAEALPAEDGTVAPPKPKTEAEVTAGMAAEISKGLGYTKEGEEDSPEAKAALQAAAKTVDGKPVEKTPAKVPEQPKAKTLDELQLTAVEKKAMHAKTQARFQEVFSTLKERTAEVERLTSERKGLAEARDTILGVLEETHTSNDELANLLEWNRLIKEGTSESMGRALQVLEVQRTALLKLLGREAPGFDPLEAHKDLQDDVEEARITRERALEIASHRTDKSRADGKAAAEARALSASRQDAESRSAASQGALAKINAWASKVAGEDIDYKAKEGRVLAAIAGIVTKYPPALWLQTIQMLYESLPVAVEAKLPASGNGPLRPSGAKGGGPAPNSMLEAISQGLGYGAKT